MKKEIVLINNSFLASEMKFLITELIQAKINFHKLNRLSLTEGNCDADTSFDTLRLEYLQDVLDSLDDLVEDPKQEFLIRCVIELD